MLMGSKVKVNLCLFFIGRGPGLLQQLSVDQDAACVTAVPADMDCIAKAFNILPADTINFVFFSLFLSLSCPCDGVWRVKSKMRRVRKSSARIGFAIV